MTVLLAVGLGLVILGAVVLLFIPDRPGGTISWAGVHVSSKGAGLPLIALGVASIAYSRTGDDQVVTTTSTEEAIVFADSFSTPGERRWQDDADAEGTGGQYTDGAYQISTTRVTGRSGVLASPRIAPSGENVRITVEARRAGGTASVAYGYGLFCRGDGPADLYAFTLWANHSVIAKRVGGRTEDLATGDRVTAGDGETSRELEAVCTTVRGGSGVELQLWVNDELILSATDTEAPYASGGVGLQALLPPGGGTLGETLEIEFDDFEVRTE